MKTAVTMEVSISLSNTLGDNCIQNAFGEVYRLIYGRKFSFTVTLHIFTCQPMKIDDT